MIFIYENDIEKYLHNATELPSNLYNPDGTVMSFRKQAAIITQAINNNSINEHVKNIVSIWSKCLNIEYNQLIEKISNDIKSKKFNKMDGDFTFIDLFCGLGGFKLAMQKYNGKCVFSSDFNLNVQKTYYHNYGIVPYGDITDSSIKDMIPDNIDILCMGFPCQSFSIAGKRLGFEDTRGTLFFDAAEIIKKHKPKVVFAENVKNLETHDNGNTFEVIKATLEELGYYVYHKVMDSAKYADIPQHRERIIIIAFNKDKVIDYKNFRFPNQIELRKTIHDCLDETTIKDNYFYTNKCSFYDTLLNEVINKNTIYQWRRKYCRENKSNLCPTLTANMGTGGHNVPIILTDKGIRKLSPKECINFMGYPSNYEFSHTISDCAKYMQAGNSVVVPMIERITDEIIKVLYT